MILSQFRVGSNMSYERDKGNEHFTSFQFKEAFRWFLRARKKFFTEGKQQELINVDLKIARCFGILGRRDEALDLLEELYAKTNELLLVEDNINVILELTTVHFIYGNFIEGNNWLDKIDEDLVPEDDPQIFFRYWQLKAQHMLVYHQLDEARHTVKMLSRKAQEMGNDPYYHELQVVLAQIDAEEGNVLKAYSSIDKAFKYFESTPFERSAFEKKIILSQFVKEPEETIGLIDEYMQRYEPEDVYPLVFNAQKIDLEYRSNRINKERAIEKAERNLLQISSLELKELEAKTRRLLAGFYHSSGEFKKAYQTYTEARYYFSDQNMEYEEAVTFFIFLPVFLQMYSAKRMEVLRPLLFNQTDDFESLEREELEEEMENIYNIFIEYNDEVKAKMTKFFELSFRITSVRYGKKLSQSINEIDQIHQWMVSEGEIYYSEMIANFLDLIEKWK